MDRTLLAPNGDWTKRPGMRETVEAPDTKQQPINTLLSTAQSHGHRPAYIPHSTAARASEAANQTDQPIRHKAQRHSMTTKPQRKRERGIDR